MGWPNKRKRAYEQRRLGNNGERIPGYSERLPIDGEQSEGRLQVPRGAWRLGQRHL